MIENVILAFAMVSMALIPVIEIALRAMLGTGIAGAASFTQHFVLIVGILGAAVAAREGRLISLAAVPALLRGQGLEVARLIASAVAVAVSALFCAASMQLVLAERAGGNVIAYGIPVWVGQAILLVGFALIAWRTARAASQRWPVRVAFITAAAAAALAAAHGMPLTDSVAWTAIVVVILATALGAPVFAAIGGTALLLFWSDGLPIAALALDHYRLVLNPSLPMLPLFALVGFLLAEGGAPRRLIRVFEASFGASSRGAALVTVLACAFFTCFSGVTIIALGGMLLPLLLKAGYKEKRALGLLAAAGSLGGLLPPGLPLVLYAVVARIPIRDMFLAGIVPAVLMLALVALWGSAQGTRRHDVRHSRCWHEVVSALYDAKWELALPPVVFIALFSGLATPVEAAVVAVIYALAIEVLVYRDLGVRQDLPRVLKECGLLVGGILLILGVALGLSNYLVDARIPVRAVEWAAAVLPERWMFLVVLNLFLILVGCFLDIFSAIVVLAPLLLPLANAFGVDPIHLGIILLVNLELGYLTPPIGMNLYFTASRFNKPLPEIFRAALPAAGAYAIGMVAVTALPFLSTGLPRLLGSQL